VRISLASARNKVVYAGGGVAAPNGDKQLGWAESRQHRPSQLPSVARGHGAGPREHACDQVPTGGSLPKDGRVQMYPCHSFEFHVVLMAIDPALASRKSGATHRP